MKKLVAKFVLAVCLLVSASVCAEAKPKVNHVGGNKKKEIVVYRSPTCGCCGKWIQHLEGNGFTVVDKVTADVQVIKDKYGVSRSLASCHTAVVNGYIVEGHVPAEDINTMLRSKPRIKGLSVPGMVTGSPGMEMGERKDPYKVISFDDSGKLRLYKDYKEY